MNRLNVPVNTSGTRSNRLITIYALQSPTDNSIQYIGQAVDAKKRFGSHLSKARNSDKYLRAEKSFSESRMTPCEKWIYDLWLDGLEPKLIILAVVHSREASEAEKDFIQLFSSYTVLLNLNHSGIPRELLA